MGDELTDIIDFLRGREHAVQAQITTLTADLKRIRDALMAVGAEPQPGKGHAPRRTDDEPTAVSEESESRTSNAPSAPGTSQRRYGRPVRAIVLDVLESENRAWTSAEVQEAVAAEVGPERVDDKLKATVRTALWTLSKHGQSVKDDSSRHTATKWLLTSTETPAATGVSGTATTSGLGGEDHEAQDHRHDPFRRNGVHLDRTPVGG